MTTPTEEIGTYETGFWFYDKDKVVHRMQPNFNPVWKLITVESQWALHDGPGRYGIFHSSHVVEKPEEIEGMERCERCFGREVLRRELENEE